MQPPTIGSIDIYQNNDLKHSLDIISAKDEKLCLMLIEFHFHWRVNLFQACSTKSKRTKKSQKKSKKYKYKYLFVDYSSVLNVSKITKENMKASF